LKHGAERIKRDVSSESLVVEQYRQKLFSINRASVLFRFVLSAESITPGKVSEAKRGFCLTSCNFSG
ncbi:MAG: hypothetical protein E6562_18945, partial [Pantoea sp.]|uniref:hypothetical protein n=1 Tax=Pantoea sp. TaxID=69393 RepID=UPI0029084AF9